MGQHGKVRHAVIDSLACCLALGHGDVISGNPSGPQCRQVASRGAARMLGGRGYAPAQDARGCTFAARALGGAGFSGRAHFRAFWRVLRVARAAPAARPVCTRGVAASRCEEAIAHLLLFFFFRRPKAMSAGSARPRARSELPQLVALVLQLFHSVGP